MSHFGGWGVGYLILFSSTTICYFRQGPQKLDVTQALLDLWCTWELGLASGRRHARRTERAIAFRPSLQGCLGVCTVGGSWVLQKMELVPY